MLKYALHLGNSLLLRLWCIQPPVARHALDELKVCALIQVRSAKHEHLELGECAVDGLDHLRLLGRSVIRAEVRGKVKIVDVGAQLRRQGLEAKESVSMGGC